MRNELPLQRIDLLDPRPPKNPVKPSREVLNRWIDLTENRLKQLHDREGISPLRPMPREDAPEIPICRTNMEAFCASPEHADLVTQREVLCMKRGLAAENRTNRKITSLIPAPGTHMSYRP